MGAFLEAMKIFSGLSAFPITPMTPSGEIIAEEMAGLVRHIEAGGADSIGLLGSTGTYMFLARHERRRAVATAVASATSIPVIVGVGALRTDDACDMAQDAASEGAAGLLLAPVSYTPLTEDEVYAHFAAVASATHLPLCIYSNPDTTNFTFSPKFVARLAGIPNIAAIKLPLPTGDMATDLALFRAAAPSFLIGYSGDWGCKDALLAGSDCWFSVAGGLFPVAASALTKAAMAGDREEADRQDAAFADLWNLFRTHGSLRIRFQRSANAASCLSAFADLWNLFRTHGSLRIIHEGARMKGLTTTELPRPLLAIDEDLRVRVASALL